jgi:hypothetical protein
LQEHFFSHFVFAKGYKGRATQNIINISTHTFHSYSGNLGLYPSKEAKKKIVIIVIPTVGVLSLLLFLAAYYFCQCKKKRIRKGMVLMQQCKISPVVYSI